MPKPEFTEEHKNNISKGHKGQNAWNKGLKGVIKASDRQKQIVSDLFKGTVVCFDTTLLVTTRVAKDLYYSDSRYISCVSKEYKELYKKESKDVK